MTAYDTTFLLWTNDYRVEFFFSFSFRVLSSSLIISSTCRHSSSRPCSRRSRFSPRRTILIGIHAYFLYIKQLVSRSTNLSRFCSD